MTPRHNPSSVEVVVEAPGGEPKAQTMAPDSEREMTSSRRQEHRYDSSITLTRTSSDRQREKPRRSHRNAPNSSASRNSTKTRARSSTSRFVSPASRNDSSASTRQQHRRTLSHPSGPSSDSSSGDEEPIEDHRVVLTAARASLTSPSLISTLTSLTTATNNSGSSSGSNSTVTQASMTRNLVPKESGPVSEAPISPAVPDPPDVFSYLDNSPDEEDDDMENEEPTPQVEAAPQWLSGGIYDSSPLPRQISLPIQESMSSSGSSSFHSDEGSERLAGNETDRSTSPEQSVKGEDEAARPDPAIRTDPAASKLASQMLAAQHRQSLHEAFQSSGSPRVARGNAVRPQLPSQALSPRLPPHIQGQNQSRGEQIPITGYEALASKLSTHSTKSPSIKPIYRKFERLNNRLLLHLQDELAELEEQLHMLDNADTQSRSRFDASGNEIRVIPASRRGAAHAGGELEWHRMDLINRISFKLAQYNQVLTSFNKLTQELDSPDVETVKKFRHYLQNEKPVVENETKFLDAAGDLVTLGRKSPPRTSEVERAEAAAAKPRKVHFEKDASPNTPSASPSLRIVALTVAAAVLIPILTFTVIPSFLGCLVVVVVVASAAMALSCQWGVASADFLGTVEGASCMAIYAGVMIVTAGVTAGVFA